MSDKKDDGYLCSERVREWLGLFAGKTGDSDCEQRVREAVQRGLEAFWHQLLKQSPIELGSGSRSWKIYFDPDLHSQALAETVNQFPDVIDGVLGVMLPVLFEASVALSLTPSLQRIEQHFLPDIQQRQADSLPMVLARRWRESNFTNQFLDAFAAIGGRDKKLGKRRLYGGEFLKHWTLEIMRILAPGPRDKNKEASIFYSDIAGPGISEETVMLELREVEAGNRQAVKKRGGSWDGFRRLLKRHGLDYEELLEESGHKSPPLKTCP